MNVWLTLGLVLVAFAGLVWVLRCDHKDRTRSTATDRVLEQRSKDRRALGRMRGPW